MLRGLTLTSSAPRLSCLKRISTRSFGSHNLNVCHRVVNTNNNSFFLNRRLPQRRRPIAASFSTPLSFHAKQSFTAEAKITEPQVEKLYQEENEDKGFFEICLLILSFLIHFFFFIISPINK